MELMFGVDAFSYYKSANNFNWNLR